MKRALYLIGGVAVAVGIVASALDGNLLAAVWAVVALMWWIAAGVSAAQVAAEREYSQMVERSWITYQQTGRGAVRRFKERHVLHAPGLPCGVDDGLWATGSDVNCPICVAIERGKSS